MERHEVVSRILQAVRVSSSQVDLVGRVLALEGDDRVHSIGLHHGTVGYGGLSAQVYLSDDFQDVGEFRGYLEGHALPTERTREKNGTYFLVNDGVKVEFFVPDFYPPR